MDIIQIIASIAVLGSIALILGILVLIADSGNKEQDPKLTKIRECLPGADCGGCGFSSCDEYAKAVLSDAAAINLCKVGGRRTHTLLSEVTGDQEEEQVRMRAQVMCSGTSSLSRRKYDYTGLTDCHSVAKLGNGPKECQYACIGLGSCVKACPFNAIKVENGVAVVEYEKCQACGQCVQACPQNIIKLIPFDMDIWVGCSSHDKPSIVKSGCKVGCISCRECVHVCESEAISIEKNCAVIDYSKCSGCGLCVEACPRKIIWSGVSQIRNGDTITESSIRDTFEDLPKTESKKFNDRNGG